jgi:hypothetical protein
MREDPRIRIKHESMDPRETMERVLKHMKDKDGDMVGKIDAGDDWATSLEEEEKAIKNED